MRFHSQKRIGTQAFAKLRQRVGDELTTTFATPFETTISLADAIQPEVIRAYAQRATGKKYLIDPWF
ncbi:MAG: hypothetical protein ACSLE1_18680 [Sphingobium sp.]